MAIRRPDTPLAATVFGNVGDPKQTPQQKRDAIIAAKKKQEQALAIKRAEIAKQKVRTDSISAARKAKLDAILAEKRAEAAKKKATSDSIQKVRVEQFAQKANKLGLTVKQYSKKLEKQNKGGDQPTSSGDYSQKRGINPCPGGRCRR